MEKSNILNTIKKNWDHSKKSAFGKWIKLAVVSSIIFVSGLLYWLNQHNNTVTVRDSEIKKHVVVVQQVETQELVMDFQTVILVQPWTEVVLKPTAQSTIKEIHVKVGDKVQLNQVLVKLDSESQKIKGELDKIDREMKDIDFAVTMNLAKKDFLSRNEVKTKELEYKANNLKAKLSDLENSGVIKTPIQGIISEVALKTGDYIDGNGNYYIKVIDNSKLKSSAYVPKDIVRFLKLGQKVLLKQNLLNNGETTELTAFISAIAPTVDTKTGSVLIELSIPSQNHNVIAGSYLDLVLELTRKESLAISEKSLVMEDNKSYVYKIENPTNELPENSQNSDNRSLASNHSNSDRFVANKIPVQIGLRTNGIVEIKSGLEEFDQVVMQGMSGLSDGQEVEIVQP